MDRLARNFFGPSSRVDDVPLFSLGGALFPPQAPFGRPRIAPPCFHREDCVEKTSSSSPKWSSFSFSSLRISVFLDPIRTLILKRRWRFFFSGPFRFFFFHQTTIFRVASRGFPLEGSELSPFFSKPSPGSAHSFFSSPRAPPFPFAESG